MGVSEKSLVVGSEFTVSRMNATDVLNLARDFVMEYYRYMKKCPSALHRFYKDDSSMIHEDSTVFGQRPIHNKIMSMNIHDCRVGILKLDALRANGNSVLIQVAGEISLNHCEPRRFMQSFVLCEQVPYDFYVLSDIFRYQDHVFSDAKFEEPLVSAPLSPVNFQTDDVVRTAPVEDTSDTNSSLWNTARVQSEGYSKPTLEVHETNSVNHTESNQNEPDSSIEVASSLPTRPDSRTPNSSHIQPAAAADEIAESPPTTQPCSWAQMASKKPHNMMNAQPVKPRLQPSTTVSQSVEEAKNARPVAMLPAQRPRGNTGRPQPIQDGRSASGDHVFESRPSGQSPVRGSGRGASGFGMRGAGRGRGSLPSVSGRSTGSGYPRRGQ